MSVSPSGNCSTVTVNDDGSAVVASCGAVINQTGGGGISDGDKGDITVSGTGTVWTIDNSAVTYAKIQDVAQTKLIGRTNTSSGPPQEITVGSGLKLSGTTLSTDGVVSGTTTITAGTGLTGGVQALSSNVSVGVDFGTVSGKVCEGNDARLTDARTPTTHKTSHETGGTDAIAPADIGAAAATHTHGVGDLTAGSASSGQVLTYNGTAWAPATPAGGSAFDPATKSETWSDFLGANAQPWTTLTNGTGASTSFSNSGGAPNPGVISLSTGTTSTGRAAVGSNNQDALVLGTYAHTFSTAVLLFTNVSTATERFIVEAGFLDALNGPTEGVYFRYSDNINGGNWECVCSSGGSSTTVDSGTAVADTVWYRFDIEVNAAASSVVFKLNGSTVATITTNIPSGTGERVGVLVSNRKTVGTTARQTRVDYLHHTSAVTR